MTNDPGFVQFILDQLGDELHATTRAMFGGNGLYHGGVFFGLIDDDRLFFFTDEAGRGAFEERGMRPFEPWPGHTMATYWQVPDEVVEEAPLLREWARRAIDARRRKPTRAKRTSPPSRRPQASPRRR